MTRSRRRGSTRAPEPPPARVVPARVVPARVVIDAVTPQIDGGRFPIKRVIGEEVIVGADIFADGHDRLAADLRYRSVGSKGDADVPWTDTPMEPLGNDRWEARFIVEELGRYEYTIVAWVDRFGSWQHGLAKKVEAGQDVGVELAEGAALVRDAAAHDSGASYPQPDTDRAWLIEQAAALAGDDEDDHEDDHEDEDEDAAAAAAENAENVAMRAALTADPRLAERMRARAERRGLLVAQPTLAVTVERVRARTGAWYEMFPRSAGPDPTRSATFDEAAARLPDIAAMGFDVVYLPPIHPIGRSFRKGRNNALVAGPGDPGSPWAIGSEEGGHEGVDPALGTFEDFERFVATARRLDLEIALDLAYQCSPDHPYVRAHPEWFRHRPDGSIKYAENPPKKYQDIYPLDFETTAWRELWEELEGIILLWAAAGVKIFRVDNPHTKPFRFWEWLIADVRRVHPDVVLLSEAFTRPRVMEHLAKLGFSQSYTYFTWRHTKEELVEYFTQLTSPPVREYLRPNLFANTPDILHEYLQTGGRSAFQVRLILAATLGANYGIYSGFELCENRAVRPGAEEYLDSEKFEFKQRDWNQPGHLRELVAHVNQIRHEEPALQSDWSLRFHDTDNPQIIAYSKETPTSALLIVVNLDTQFMQHGWVRVPRADWGLDAAAYDVVDLLSGDEYRWSDDWNYVRLDPDVRPAHILKIVKREIPTR